MNLALKEPEVSQAVEKAISPEACFCAASLMGQEPLFSFCLLSSSLFCLGANLNLSTTDNVQTSVHKNLTIIDAVLLQHGGMVHQVGVRNGVLEDLCKDLNMHTQKGYKECIHSAVW